MMPDTVSIDLKDRSYDIHIGRDLLTSLPDCLPMEVQDGNFFILTDENVKNVAEQVVEILEAANARVCKMMVLPAGEASKSFDKYQEITRWMLQNEVDRKSTLLAVGGGVIGDLAGFAAATVLRGIHYVQIPTTLLAQVDSSVGGKTGINVPEGKNLIGAFYQPRAVIVDLGTLKSLPERELKAGYAEIVKYGLLGDAEFFGWLEKNGASILRLEAESLLYAVKKSVQAKARIVSRDEKESGVRALLNLGHTFGHALEAAAGYDGRLLHGEAVSIGMVMAFEMSVRMGLCHVEDLERVKSHLSQNGLLVKASQISPSLQTDPDALIELMHGDKKAAKGKINFIMVQGIGRAFVTSDVSLGLAHEILSESLQV